MWKSCCPGSGSIKCRTDLQAALWRVQLSWQGSKVQEFDRGREEKNMKICAATGNAGKLRELRRILEAQGHEVVSQKELGITIAPE